MQFESVPSLSTKGAYHVSPGHRPGLVCGNNKALKAVPQGVALGWYVDGPLALPPTQVKAHAVFHFQ